MAVARGPIDDYVDGFRDRLAAMRQPGQEIVDEPGILALVGRDRDTLDGRVLVVDDRAQRTLESRLGELRARVISVLDAAGESHTLLAQNGLFRPNRCTAMVRDDLGTIAERPLPDGLILRPVRATPRDGTEVALVDAAEAALRADREMAPVTDLGSFVDYLRSVPRTQYLAAVDDGGVVRATAAAASWGRTAGVFFVNTDPAWRGRGVGTAMTAAALRTALLAGAERACLDASALGLSIYRRLGFVSAGPLTQFVPHG